MKNQLDLENKRSTQVMSLFLSERLHDPPVIGLNILRFTTRESTGCICTYSLVLHARTEITGSYRTFAANLANRV